jgi:hypothetical protein
MMIQIIPKVKISAEIPKQAAWKPVQHSSYMLILKLFPEGVVLLQLKTSSNMLKTGI